MRFSRKDRIPCRHPPHPRILLLFLLFLLSRSSVGSSSRTTPGSRSSAHAGTHVGDQVADAHGGQGLGEQAGPDGLDLHIGSLEDGCDLLSCYWDVVIGQDESGISARKLVDAHGDAFVGLLWMDA